MEVVTECLVHDSGEATTSVMSIYHSSRLFVYTRGELGVIIGGRGWPSVVHDVWCTVFFLLLVCFVHAL